MNKVIQDQLNKVRVADLSHFDKTTNSYFIPRKTSIILKKDSTYKIKINEAMLKPNTISDNWNNGSIPPFNECIALVVEVMKNMVNILGTSNDKVWNGWLLTNEIEIIEKVEE